MFWTEEKLKYRIEELSQYRYRDSLEISSFKYRVDDEGEIGTRPPVVDDWETKEIGGYWEGRDIYIWLAAKVNIPKAWSEHQVVGYFDFGKTGHGGNSGFESLLYVNGIPYQGVDSNHKEVFLANNLSGSNVELIFRLWSGLEGGGIPEIQKHRLQSANIAWLDEDVDDLYFTAKAVLETVNILESKQTERIDLLEALDKAFKLIDWSYPSSNEFYDTIYQARESLWGSINAIEKHHNVTINCIGHTHIDVAWLWRLKHSHEKAARSFSTVCRLMEKYPEYVFLQTQPQLYEYIKQDYPEIYEQIGDLVKAGRWEAEGGMWLEADCNLSSGESLVRQILYGINFFKEEFDVECTYLWLPDVFGYSWALPQILKKSGLNTFMTTKISWSQYNKMPHDTFKWRGIDGTEILTHFITTPHTSKSSDLWYYTYNGIIEPSTVQGIWDVYNDKQINRELLMCYGYGDGGGGVNREMLEMRRRLDKIPGLPHVKTGRADEYFKELNKRVESTDQYVHTWDGELYLEYHRGTYTSQAYNKRMNRKLELSYRELEFTSALNCLTKRSWNDYPKDALDEGWKIILRNQFHDILPGSSIHEVYEDSRKEYEKAEQLAQINWNNQIKPIISLDQLKKEVTIFNSSSWKRSELVYMPKEEGVAEGTWISDKGKELFSQDMEEGWLIQVENIPSMGFSTIYIKTDIIQKKHDVSFIKTSLGINTPYYEIEWNNNGQLTKIYDREAESDVLEVGARGNVLQVFEDKPRQYDAWDIDIYYQEKMREVTELQVIEIKEIGLLRAVVYFEWNYMNSIIKQKMILYKNSRRIDFETEVNWKEHQQFMKVAFPVQIRATEATYDIQFGNVKRPTHWNTSWDHARFEVVAHQWADLSERGFGVSLLNDCKYGYDIKNNMMRLSLIKSAIYPDPQADQGEHVFTYSLLPHLGNWEEAKTVHEAWALNNPLKYIQGKAMESSLSVFYTSNERVMIDVVKKAEKQNKVILRMHEFTGSRGKVEVFSDLIIKSWQECDLMEKVNGEKYMSGNMEFDIKPYEIKTYMIEFQ